MRRECDECGCGAPEYRSWPQCEQCRAYTVNPHTGLPYWTKYTTAYLQYLSRGLEHWADLRVSQAVAKAMRPSGGNHV